MSIDPYAPCLCGSGKKLKFCCADLAGDIEKILRMIEGEQPHAALRHVEQTLVRFPERASLMDLQAVLEISLGEAESARATITKFLQAHPNNASASADKALLLAKSDDGRAAVLPLQKALAQVSRNMPRRVLEAIGAVGHALLLAGHVVAAQAHLWLYTAIAPSDDTRALELLVRLNRLSGLPTLLRESLRLRNWPADAPWKSEAEEASRLADRGRWYQAVPIIDHLGQRYGPDPALVYNRAVLGGWLADERALVAGLHAFARLDVPWDDAVEAEAIAQLVDPHLKDPTFDTVKREFAVTDMEVLEQRLVTDGRAEAYDADPQALGKSHGPRPRLTYLLLDRSAPATGAEITRHQVPSVLGFLWLFGRQTDRAERLEVVVDQGPHFDEAMNTVAQIAGDALGEVLGDKTIGTGSQVEQALSWRWHFPTDTPPLRRRELLAEQRRDAILNRWPDVPRSILGGKSPREASGDAELQIPLAAAVLVLEQGSSNYAQAEALAELRRELGLPSPAKVSPQECDLSELPLVRLPRLKIQDVTDEQLVNLYRRAVLADAAAAILATAREALCRPSVADKISKSEAYQRLITHESDPTVALELVGEARRAAEQAGESTADWDLAELDLQLSEGSFEEIQRILDRISSQHGSDPEVAAAVYQLLYDAGVIEPEDLTADATPAASVPEVAAANVSDAGAPRVWTPGSDSPREKKSQLWTPS